MKRIIFAVFILSLISTLYAEEKTQNSTKNEDYLPQLPYGKLHFEVRLRYEYADEDDYGGDNHVSSEAYTVRTQLGYETPDFFGFSGLAELENTIPFKGDTYDAYPGPQGEAGKTVIADPESTELNRAQISFKKYKSEIIGGRQLIILDNWRYVGNVVWRQNEQTFDGITLNSKILDDLKIFYGYIIQANRIFGSEAENPDQRHFEMKSHLVNVNFTKYSFARICGYSYLIRMEKDDAVKANSSDTFGGFVKGTIAINEDASINYRGEYARQKDNMNSPKEASYGLNYYHAVLGGNVKMVLFGGGYERLDGDGTYSFATPLATLHRFNGWADVFLATPKDGLIDAYGWLGIKLPYNVLLKGVYHSFYAENSTVEYGKEYDAVLKWQLDKHFTFLAKYSEYAAEGSSDNPKSNDIVRYWAQLDFMY